MEIWKGLSTGIQIWKHTKGK